MTSTVMLLFFMVYFYIGELFRALNIPIDYITAVVVVWNNAITGILAILWKGPLVLQQAYLIFDCSLMALAFIKFLPEWTTWVVLLMISVWDLVAVLCPGGPLRILVETAHARGEDLTKLPAMVYSSMLYPLMSTSSIICDLAQHYGTMTIDKGQINNQNAKEPADSKKSGEIPAQDKTASDSNNSLPPEEKSKSSSSTVNNKYDSVPDDINNSDSDENNSPLNNSKNRDGEIIKKIAVKKSASDYSSNKRSVPANNDQGENPILNESPTGGVKGAKLGLGDFVFYSVLIGKAAVTDDWTVIIACILAILIGLGLTLVLLVMFKQALPALPISIILGLMMYFGFYYITSPFLDKLSENNFFL
ncbi:unnamed protein product [Gordionus sp. m RMFG-2023]